MNKVIYLKSTYISHSFSIIWQLCWIKGVSICIAIESFYKLNMKFKIRILCSKLNRRNIPSYTEFLTILRVEAILESHIQYTARICLFWAMLLPFMHYYTIMHYVTSVMESKKISSITYNLLFRKNLNVSIFNHMQIQL